MAISCGIVRQGSQVFWWTPFWKWKSRACRKFLACGFVSFFFFLKFVLCTVAFPEGLPFKKLAVTLDHISSFMCCSYYPISCSKFGRCHWYVKSKLANLFYIFSTVSVLILIFFSKIIFLVAGKHLAEHCRNEYPRIPNFILWVLAEIAIVACDIPEGEGISGLLLSITCHYMV